MSCDLITAIAPHVLINTHRAQNPTCTALLYEFKAEDRPARQGPDHDTQIIGIDSVTHQWLYTMPKADLEMGLDSLSLRTSLLKKCVCSRVSLVPHSNISHRSA